MGFVTVKHADGTIYNTNDYGARIIDFIVPSPNWSHQTQSIEGGDGVIPLLSTYEEKIIQLSFNFFATSMEDYIAKRDLFYQVFISYQTFYVIDSKRPTIRWGVRAEPFTIERQGLRGTVQIDLKVFSGNGETESINTSAASTSTFTVLNPGTAKINMEKQSDTEIEFKGASTNLIIRNLSTGQEWSWTGSTILTDTILLKGITAKKNTVSIFGLSNRKSIDLKPGNNDFQIVGATGSYTTTIRTRYYYL